MNLNLYLALIIAACLLYLLIATLIQQYRNKTALTEQAKKSLYAKRLTVKLALAVAYAGTKMSALQLQVIKSYIKRDIAPKHLSQKIACYLKLLFQHFLIVSDGNQCSRISKQITALTDLAGCCDILDLCVRVVGTCDIVITKQLIFLKNISEQLGIDNEAFRFMLEKNIPVSKYKFEDFEIILGITSDMDASQTNSQLGKEYIKWNNRITNSNPQIRKQAQDMLNFIAKAKSLNK
ncbi:MAG TPA: hypothetical protein PLP05_01575 [Sedimentisphaerales bacterium]|nr:hypothetical protein [Sedimentisphaerales bacterium]